VEVTVICGDGGASLGAWVSVCQSEAGCQCYLKIGEIDLRNTLIGQNFKTLMSVAGIRAQIVVLLNTGPT
jgi:hypothetical protein